MYQAVVTRYIEGAQVKRYACERPTASQAEALWLCYSWRLPYILGKVMCNLCEDREISRAPFILGNCSPVYSSDAILSGMLWTVWLSFLSEGCREAEGSSGKETQMLAGWCTRRDPWLSEWQMAEWRGQSSKRGQVWGEAVCAHRLHGKVMTKNRGYAGTEVSPHHSWFRKITLDGHQTKESGFGRRVINNPTGLT